MKQGLCLYAGSVPPPSRTLRKRSRAHREAGPAALLLWAAPSCCTHCRKEAFADGGPFSRTKAFAVVRHVTSVGFDHFDQLKTCTAPVLHQNRFDASLREDAVSISSNQKASTPHRSFSSAHFIPRPSWCAPLANQCIFIMVPIARQESGCGVASASERKKHTSETSSMLTLGNVRSSQHKEREAKLFVASATPPSLTRLGHSFDSTFRMYTHTHMHLTLYMYIYTRTYVRT